MVITAISIPIFMTFHWAALGIATEWGVVLWLLLTALLTALLRARH